MTLVHDKLSHCALQVYEVSTKYLTDGQKKHYNRSNNSKNIQSRVMVLVHETLSYCA